MNLLILAGLGVAAFIGAMYFSKNAEEKTSTMALAAGLITLVIMAYIVVKLQIGVVKGEAGRTTNIPIVLLMLVGIPIGVYFMVYLSMNPETEEVSPWEGKTISEMIEQDKDIKRAGILIVIAALIGLMLIWRYGR